MNRSTRRLVTTAVVVMLLVGFVVSLYQPWLPQWVLMSDTPPVQFFTHHWLLGGAAAVAIGTTRASTRAISLRGHGLARALGAAVEAGVFVVLPVTAVWQAATALGWTTSWFGHLVLGAAAAVSAVAIARRAWCTHEGFVLAVLLATAYALTGSGIAPLLGAVLVELGRFTQPQQDTAQEDFDMIDPTTVSDFLAGRRVAVVGASDDPKNFGGTIFRALVDHGYDAVPVNPRYAAVGDRVCYPDLAAVDGKVDGVLVMVKAAVALGIIDDAAHAGVDKVWLFKGLGSPGAVSDEVLARCDQYGMTVVAGACPLMFLEPVGGFHKFHRALRRLNGSVGKAA